MYYVVFSHNAGWTGILGGVKGLRRATLPQHTERAAYDLLGNSWKDAVLAPQRFGDLMDRYRAYFSGHQTDFPHELDLAGATLFQQAVWRAARLIPHGQTRSYTWVAAQAGSPKAVRAAGQALARNPLPVIIPCHRVLTGDGGIGGFSGGLQMKRLLLKLEANPAENA